MKHTIDYGFEIAVLYTPSEDWQSRFYDLANQCFGIRNSIMKAELLSKEAVHPKLTMDGEYERLEHNGDVIVWDKDGNKIKSEFDD